MEDALARDPDALEWVEPGQEEDLEGAEPAGGLQGQDLWEKLKAKHKGSRVAKGKSEAGYAGAWAKLLDDPKMTPPASWDDRFEVLLAFKEKHGHCDVPPHYPVQWLASWVSQQRTDYDLFARFDPRTPMTDEQVRKLTEAHFDWEGLSTIGFASGGVNMIFTPNGWEHTNAAATNLLEARHKLEDQQERIASLVTQLRDAKAETRQLRQGQTEGHKAAEDTLAAENRSLREANARLLESLAVLRVDEKKSHEAYLRQKLHIRGFKQELLRCYDLLRDHDIDPTPSAIASLERPSGNPVERKADN